MSDKTFEPGSPNDTKGEESLLGGAGGAGSGGEENPTDDRGKVERLFRKDFTETNSELFQGVDNVTDLVSGLLEQRNAAVFRDGMSPEELGAYRKLHGIPDKSTDYAFSGLDMFDEPVAQQLAHEAGLSQKQAKYLEKWAKLREDQREKRIDSQKLAMRQESKDWLETTYGQNAHSQLIRAHSVLQRFGNAEFVKEVTESGLGNSQRFIAMLLNFADSVSESNATNVKNAGGEPVDPTKSDEAFYNTVFGN